MKSLHKPNVKDVSNLNYLPVIEANPNELSTVQASLMEIMRLTNGRSAVATHDLPLWNKSTNVTLQKSLAILNR